jgi:hypothetical protein
MKKKRPKLVYGHAVCPQVWIERVRASEDPDNDPLTKVKTADSYWQSCFTSATDTQALQTRSYYGRWTPRKFLREHPIGTPTRKVESTGSVLWSFGTYPIARFIRTPYDELFFINCTGADLCADRAKRVVFDTLTFDHPEYVPTMVDNALMLCQDVPAVWPAFEQMYVERMHSCIDTKSWHRKSSDQINAVKSLCDNIAMERNRIINAFAITPMSNLFEEERAKVVELVTTKEVTKKLAA